VRYSLRDTEQLLSPRLQWRLSSFAGGSYARFVARIRLHLLFRDKEDLYVQIFPLFNMSECSRCLRSHYFFPGVSPSTESLMILVFPEKTFFSPD